MDEEKIEKTRVWQLFEIGRNYNVMQNLYADTDKNHRMYNGNQWQGLIISGIEPVQLNIIKPIIRYKVGVINSNAFLPIFSAENLDNDEFKDIANKTCDLLNKFVARAWEKNNIDFFSWEITKEGAINDECPIYLNWNEESKIPDIEILSKNDIYYGNENSDDIQTQPYILIKKRDSLVNIIRQARASGIDEEKIKYIQPDMDYNYEAGENSKYEVDPMCTLITKFYKKDGKVYYSKATQFCEIVNDEDSGLTLYPVTHFLWERKVGYSRGEGEVRYLIPNQLEINKTIMRRLISAKNTAYPQKIVDKSKILNPSAINKSGSTIEINGETVDDVKKAIGILNPAQMSTDVEKVMNELITTTRELAGAGDVATGQVNPEDASGKAILAVQQASQMPMSEQVVGLKSVFEDIAKITFEMIKTYNKKDLVISYEEMNYLTAQNETKIVKIPKNVLKKLELNVKIDVTPKSAFDRYAQELTIENLLKAGYFNVEKVSELETYVEVLDDNCTAPKQKILEAIKIIKRRQEEINNINRQAEQLQARTNQFLNNQQDLMQLQNANIGQEEMVNQPQSQSEIEQQ